MNRPNRNPGRIFLKPDVEEMLLRRVYEHQPEQIVELLNKAFPSLYFIVTTRESLEAYSDRARRIG